jgi:hypothetical protein
MWSSTVKFDALTERGRWKVEFFCSPDSGDDRPDVKGLIPIRKLVRERKESVDPMTLGGSVVNYIGLEHIQSMTGELVDYFEPRTAKEVKSRSRVFKEGDVLFGRLRPNLNKVMVAQGKASEGICSTEILVLIPDKAVILPMVLRYLLSSHYIQRHALRLQTGTALPRMSLQDLLDIEVPVPPIKVQKQLEAQLQQQFEELMTLRARVQKLPGTILHDFLQLAESGAVAS